MRIAKHDPRGERLVHHLDVTLYSEYGEIFLKLEDGQSILLDDAACRVIRAVRTQQLDGLVASDGQVEPDYDVSLQTVNGRSVRVRINTFRHICVELPGFWWYIFNRDLGEKEGDHGAE